MDAKYPCPKCKGNALLTEFTRDYDDLGIWHRNFYHCHTCDIYFVVKKHYVKDLETVEVEGYKALNSR